MSEPISSAADLTDCRLFTIEEANAMLPLVRVIVRDIKQLSNDLIDRKRRLDALANQTAQRSAVYADELSESEKSMGSDAYRLQSLVEELCDLGVQPQSLVKGQVAFPTLINDEAACFTWEFGQENVTSWDGLENDLLKGQSFESLFGQSKN